MHTHVERLWLPAMVEFGVGVTALPALPVSTVLFSTLVFLCLRLKGCWLGARVEVVGTWLGARDR